MEEVQQLLFAIDSLRYETTRDFLLMCLLTAARRSNVAAMNWEDISLERKTWQIPLTKNGSSQYVPLTDEAIKILTRRKDEARSSWVFPSDRSQTGHLMKPEEAWRMVIDRSGLLDIRINDLRRTLASWQAMTGANISVIAATLNDKDLKSTQVYARLQIEPGREAMETATTAMLKR